jgi:cytochrome c556
MKLKSLLPALAMMMVAGTPTAVFADDDRELIKLPADQQAMLLTEMRDLFESVDDLVAALSEGDIKTVIEIADLKMGFGHNQLQKMIENGATKEQIEQMRQKIRNQHGKGMGHGMGGGGGMFAGMGRFLPPEMRQMGQNMHAAAGELSATAKKIKGTPSVQDYKALLSNLQEITGACRACHVTYKLR